MERWTALLASGYKIKSQYRNEGVYEIVQHLGYVEEENSRLQSKCHQLEQLLNIAKAIDIKEAD